MGPNRKNKGSHDWLKFITVDVTAIENDGREVIIGGGCHFKFICCGSQLNFDL